MDLDDDETIKKRLQAQAERAKANKGERPVLSDEVMNLVCEQSKKTDEEQINEVNDEEIEELESCTTENPKKFGLDDQDTTKIVPIAVCDKEDNEVNTGKV